MEPPIVVTSGTAVSRNCSSEIASIFVSTIVISNIRNNDNDSNRAIIVSRVQASSGLFYSVTFTLHWSLLLSNV